MRRAADAAAAGGNHETGAGDLARRARRPDEDPGRVIDALRRWFAGHPECGDPAEAVRALGLPTMDGIPQDRAARTSAEQREWAAARDVVQHAEYVLRCRDAEPDR